jgi:hypothetical protein
MVNKIAFVPGNRLIDGSDLNNAFASFGGVQTPLTALAGGANPGTPLGYGYNNITVAATTNDSATAPQAIPGSSFTIRNAGASTVKAFGSPILNPLTGTLDAFEQTIGTPITGVTGVTVATNTKTEYRCFTASIWTQVF